MGEFGDVMRPVRTNRPWDEVDDLSLEHDVLQEDTKLRRKEVQFIQDSL